jgi:hypothetical protein
MLIVFDVLAAVRDWAAKAQDSWKGLVTASNFEESPEGRTPRSVSWSLEGSRFMGQIVVWEDGQSELDLIDSIVNDARSEHRWLGNRDELEAALCVIRDWVVRRGSN